MTIDLPAEKRENVTAKFVKWNSFSDKFVFQHLSTFFKHTRTFRQCGMLLYMSNNAALAMVNKYYNKNGHKFRLLQILQC